MQHLPDEAKVIYHAKQGKEQNSYDALTHHFVFFYSVPVRDKIPGECQSEVQDIKEFLNRFGNHLPHEIRNDSNRMSVRLQKPAGTQTRA